MNSGSSDVQSSRLTFHSRVPSSSNLALLLDHPECRDHISLALVSKGTGAEIREFLANGGKGVIERHPLDLAILYSASAASQAACDSSINLLPRARQMRISVDPDVAIRYGKTLVVIEKQEFSKARWANLDYISSIVSGCYIHERPLIARSDLPPKLDIPEESSNQCDSVDMIEHVVLLACTIGPMSPLFQRGANGKQYIAEYRTPRQTIETNPSCVETVYRILDLSGAPVNYETDDDTDRWAAVLYCRPVLRKGLVPFAKMWHNVPSSIFERPGMSAVRNILVFECVAVDEGASAYEATAIAQRDVGADETQDVVLARGEDIAARKRENECKCLIMERIDADKRIKQSMIRDLEKNLKEMKKLRRREKRRANDWKEYYYEARGKYRRTSETESSPSSGSLSSSEYEISVGDTMAKEMAR